MSLERDEMASSIGTSQPIGPTGGFGPSFGGSWTDPGPVMGGPRGSQGQLAAGIMFIIIGIVQLVIAGVVMSDPDFPGMGVGGVPFIIAGGTFLIGFALIALSFSTRNSEIAAARQQAEALEQSRIEQERHEEEERKRMVEAIKSTIKVRCRYCGSLNDESASKCESCGADL
jgi:hypothetical protein